MCTWSEGERSLENEQFTMMDTPVMQILDVAVPVESFDMEERVKSIHERRRHQSCPSQDSIRYVLFILDTSGSIGRSQFVRVKYLLALMSEKLCDHLRVAMITYGSDINLEFCFNCHTDRCGIFNAITRVQYRGRLTHTTDLCQLRTKLKQFCTQLTKAYVAETSCISCYWFCYVSAHDQFARYRQRSNEPLRHHCLIVLWHCIQ